MRQPTLLVDGAWRSTESSLPVHNPADGSVVGHVDWGSAEDASAAADAAAAALDAWAQRPPRERADLLLAGAALLTERSATIADLLAAEAGKRLPEARAEVAFSAEYLRWMAEECRRPHGTVIPGEAAHRRHLTVRRPVGVVASLTPWNFPCSIQARKLAAALAAGCTVVARVSEKAPLAVTELVRCLQDAGLPSGVLNLVHGPARELTTALLQHPAVRAVSFTGSTPVGREVMGTASRRVVRPLLELGGNAAFIVLDDADLEAAVAGAMLAKFRNAGQSCLAANRFVVHERVADEFTSRLAEQIDAMTVGDGRATPCPDLGPLIDHDRVRAVQSLVDEAVAAGGRAVTRERTVPSGGAYLAPALLVDVPHDCRLATEEVFGPVAGVFRVADDAQALRMANATETGLAAYVWTRDASRSWRMLERLEAGIVGINEALPSVAFAPMGGVKQAGLGREGGGSGLEDFSEVTYAAWSL
jgi:succinate-semialdehyde dehydrogenase / glutarate-semialdehyde dehydrogenase